MFELDPSTLLYSSLDQILAVLWFSLKLVIAGALALPTGLDREEHSRSLGLRTFPLVAVGACSYILIGEAVLGADALAARARLLQGLMTGVGFVGGGAILKSSDGVQGTASAAGVWVTGALGAAVGFGRWDLALSMALVNFLLVAGLSRVKRERGQDC